MKSLELEKFGVQELDAKEMKEIEGGSLWGLFKEAVDLAATAVETIWNAGSDIYNGLSAGYAAGKSHTRPIVK